jgi:hypothetical protein
MAHTVIQGPLPRLAAISRSLSMLDLLMLAIGFAFFALSIAYVYACDLL